MAEVETVEQHCCLTCSDFEYPAEPEVEGHVAVRWYPRLADIPPYSVLLNGEEVADRCVEARPGNPGWVILADIDDEGKKYTCPNAVNELARQMHRGRVKVKAVRG